MRPSVQAPHILPMLQKALQQQGCYQLHHSASSFFLGMTDSLWPPLRSVPGDELLQCCTGKKQPFESTVTPRNDSERGKREEGESIGEVLQRLRKTPARGAFAPAYPQSDFVHRLHVERSFRLHPEKPVSNAPAGRWLEDSPPTHSSELLGMFLIHFPFPVLETLPIHFYS